MTQPLNLAMTLSLNDRLVAPLQRALGEATKSLHMVSRELGEIGKMGANAGRGLAEVSKQADGLRQTRTEVDRLGKSTRDTEKEVSRLASAWAHVRNVTRGVSSMAAGGAAFSSVVAAPVRRAADYDTQLRGLANTAFAGQSLDARRAGVRMLDSAVTSSVRFGGGTREGAVEALNELVASGAFPDASSAAKLLPLLMRGGTASGASPVDLARIAIRGQQTFGIPIDSMAGVLDQAMAAGQAGGFELRDMAKWLPQQMAAARALGLRGEGGLAKLLAANQASVITAGTRDEAGNNLVNLLAKVNSQDTARDFGKLGIDLPGSLSAARGKGVDGLTAFVNMVDQIVSKDGRFQEARRGAAGAGTEADRRAAFEAQGDILQGSAIGKVIQDRQALMALVGLMNNRGYMADVEQKLRGSSGAMNDAFALFSEGSGFKFDQRNFEVQRAQTEAMGSANGALAKLAEAQTDLYQRYPGFASVIEGAKVAVMSFTAALVASGLVNLATRGGAAVAGVGAGAAGAGVGAGAGAGVGAGAAAGGLGLGASAGVLAAGGLVATVAATNTVANNLERFKAVAENPMLSAMSGDAGFAAAIMSAATDEGTLKEEAAKTQAEAAQTMLRAAEKLENLKIGITSDTTMFTAEIMENVVRQSKRQ